MKAMVCEMCGSHELVKQDGMYVCQSCNTKYSVEDAKKLFVTVDNTKKLENYYQLARRAKENNNAEDAAKYYDLIRQEAPNDWEANYYSVYFRAYNCKIGEIASAARSIKNCIFSTFSLIEDSTLEDEERKQAVNEVCVSAFSISTMLSDVAQSHYKGIGDSVRLNYMGELISNMSAASDIQRAICDGICKYFSYDDAALEAGIPYLKEYIEHRAAADYQEEYIRVIHRIEPEYSCYEKQKRNEEKLKATSDAFVNKSSNNSGNGCYIATAVYGSYDCPQVWTLRRYRDYTLAETWYGRAFIHTYYAISPTLVKWFGHTSWFKNIWKPMLDIKVRSLNNEGVANTPYEDKAW